MIFQCMREISGVKIKGPVYSGRVILENVAGTGISVVATRDLV